MTQYNAAMASFKVTPDGSIVVDTLDDALALSQRITQANKQRKAAVQWPVPTPTPAPTPLQPNGASPRQVLGTAAAGVAAAALNKAALTVDFLQAVKAAGDSGLGQRAIMQRYSIKAARGIPSKTGLVKKFLQSIDIPQEEVYHGVRTTFDGTAYKAGARLQEALDIALAASKEKS